MTNRLCPTCGAPLHEITPLRTHDGPLLARLICTECDHIETFTVSRQDGASRASRAVPPHAGVDLPELAGRSARRPAVFPENEEQSDFRPRAVRS
jgi:uncharacterized Zn finger protein (UPF0148 family)